jgi:hypothetical protein
MIPKAGMKNTQSTAIDRAQFIAVQTLMVPHGLQHPFWRVWTAAFI